MKKSKLKNSKYTHVRLIPPARSIFNGYRLPQRDDTWIIESDSSEEVLRLQNIVTSHVAELKFDQIHHFDADLEVSRDGIRLGYLTLLVQLTMEGVKLSKTPLPLYFKRLMAGKAPSRESIFSPDPDALSDALRVFEKKLVAGFSQIDERTVSGIRSFWGQISPLPQCPSIDTLMRQISNLCIEGVREREILVSGILMDCLNGFPVLLTELGLKKIAISIRQYFPLDLYVSVAESTQDVYQRRHASHIKFQSRLFKLSMSLIKTDINNRVRSALANVSLHLEELNIFLVHEH